jgi:plasmid maintenance system antidote protein VapI
MAYVDVPRVKGKMAERGFTITSLSEKLDVDRNTLSSYLKNPNKLPYEVVSNMAKLLCDNADEASSIFFASDLRIT